MARAKIDVAEMQKLVGGLEQGLEWLRDAKPKLTGWLTTYTIDHDLGAGVQQAIDWGDDQLPGVRRRLALAQSLEGSDPSWPTGTVTIDDSAISDVTPEQARTDGADAAKALLEAPGEISPDLAEEIRANMNDPYFAAGFAGEASPTEIAAQLDLIDAVAKSKGESGKPDFIELRNSLIVAVGTTFGTATRNTGDLALPDGYAQQWVDAITATAVWEGGDAPANQAQYLALLMQQGRYSTPFLDHVGDEIYAYERAADGSPVWGPKHNHMDPVLDLEGRPVIDVMSSFMLALENNPEAAQNFFSSGTTTTVKIDGVEYQVDERLQYMIQERGWSHDTDPSNGANLGGALEAATTHFRDNTSQGATSARIASQTFALIGAQTGSGASGGLLGLGANDGWQMWDGLRGSVATMLASYSPDLLRAANNSGATDSLGPPWTHDPETQFYGDGAPYGAVLDPALVEKLLNTFGKDGNDEHLDVVLAGVSAASQWRFSTALDDSLADGGSPSAPVAMLTGLNVPRIQTSADEMATALGWVINSAYDGALSEEELEKKRAEAMSQVFGAITSVPGVGPTAEWSKFAFDQITSQIEDKIGETDPTASGDYSELSADQKLLLEQMIINQMLASGYWDDKYIDEANGSADADRYQPPPTDAIVPGSDPPRFDFESDAYRDWHRSTFPLGDFLNANIYPPFEDVLTGGLGLPGS